jgi:hypothetical protein
VLDEGQPTFPRRPLADRRLADPHELGGLTGPQPDVLVVGRLLGCDRLGPLPGLSLALAPLCGLAASNSQSEHLVAVEGAPDALTP